MINYIKSAKRSGLTNEQILRSLVEAGWKLSEVFGQIFDNLETLYGENPTTHSHVSHAIEVRDIYKSFGDVKALQGLNLSVKKGSITALLGPNGAGKTTLVRILATLLKHDDGHATVMGHDVKKESDAVRKLIGATGQFAAIDEILTGRENLELVGRLSHLDTATTKARAQELLERFELTEAADRAGRTYSGGMKRRLDIAASLMSEPKILFLDEPTTGLDPHSRIGLWAVIKELVAQGTTILLTTQYLEEADHLADHVVVIDHGRVIAQGTTNELKSQVGGDVIEVHLSNHQDLSNALEMLAQSFSPDDLYSNAESGSITVQATKGATTLIEVLKLLDQRTIAISDIVLRRPTMDDVFLSLTGHRTA